MVNKNLAKAICSLYVKIRKNFSSDFLYKIFAEKYESKGIWPTVREYSIFNFSNYINTCEYLSDPLCGAVDFSHPESEPEYFFADLSKGRDCDNWSRIWLCYLNYHKDDWEDVTEVVLFSRDNLISCFLTSHFITIAKNIHNGKYYCFNYEYSGRTHDTFEDAVQEVCRLSKTYTPENLVWVKY